jgi:hypothetical protein
VTVAPHRRFPAHLQGISQVAPHLALDHTLVLVAHGREEIGHFPSIYPKPFLVRGRQYQQPRLPWSGGARLVGRLVLLDDEVRVGATHTERADPGAPGVYVRLTAPL